MTSSLDRSDPYKVEYLGSSILPRMATGLGALQKPLRELYFRHRKPGSGSRLQERHIAIARDCMKVKYRTGGSNSVMAEEAFPVPNVLYWDAIRFVTVKAPDKKLRGAFEPLDNDHSRCQDNLFVILDKKVGFLAQMSHPSLFVCVLRRVSGVRSLDLHAFVCANERDALAIVRALRTLQADYEHSQAHNHGVFGYTPFDQDDDVTGDGVLDVVPPSQRPAPFVGGSVRVREMAPPPTTTSDAGAARFFKLTQGDFGASSGQRRYDDTYERVISSGGPDRARAPPGGQPTAFAPPLPGHINPGFVGGNQYGRTQYPDGYDTPPSGRTQSMSRPSRYEMGASLAERMRSGSPSYERTIPRNDDRRRTIIDADDQRRSDERSRMAPSHFGQRRERVPSPPPRGSDASRSQFGASSSSSSHTRPVALVQPHKIQGIRVLPTVAMLSLKKTDLDRPKAPSPTDAFKPAPAVAKPYVNDDHVIRNLRDCRPAAKKSAADNWQFKTSRPTDFGAPSGDEISQRTTEEDKSNGRLLLTAKKDAEIAAVVQNLQLDHDTYTLSPSGVTNFEKSLGYFP
ncbi:hypothetical protein LSAT2_029363 [Lamellibrachia satsuma]|nr:hypothetical protein LSAT2_029363 [Lamellibrachia satsuma]